MIFLVCFLLLERGVFFLKKNKRRLTERSDKVMTGGKRSAVMAFRRVKEVGQNDAVRQDHRWGSSLSCAPPLERVRTLERGWVGYLRKPSANRLVPPQKWYLAKPRFVWFRIKWKNLSRREICPWFNPPKILVLISSTKSNHGPGGQQPKKEEGRKEERKEEKKEEEEEGREETKEGWREEEQTGTRTDNLFLPRLLDECEQI